ncbi:MAG: hypothetical protein JXA81_15660, partial [Sedimentisphaerales bacterium]|nr:hypothetical protein [Sedimentisphaerales bacterium]
MKTLTNTITIIAALSLLTTVVVPAQNASSEEIRYDPDINTKDAEVTAVIAQAQTGQPVTPALPSTPSPTPAAPTPPTPPALQSSASVDLVSNDLFRGLYFGSRSDSTGSVLVIPSEQATTQDLITINEDMNVMSRIFEKNLEQERVATFTSNIFIPGRRERYGALLGNSRGQIQSMYLQGFGALFLLKVDFPLSPPPDVQKEQQQETQKAEQGDPVWRQIRQEMYEPEKSRRDRRKDRPESKYDAEKVENLKTTLIQTLKHAANIRCLKPDESVILTVVGGGESTGVSIVTASGAPGQVVVVQKGPDGAKTQKLIQGNSLDALEDIGLSSPVILVIRTKKS